MFCFFVVLAGLELRVLPASASHVLRLKEFATSSTLQKSPLSETRPLDYNKGSLGTLDSPQDLTASSSHIAAPARGNEWNWE